MRSPALLPTWSTAMLSRLKAGLDRLNETRAADVIGLVGVFALPVIVLKVGALIDGGM